MAANLVTRSSTAGEGCLRLACFGYNILRFEELNGEKRNFVSGSNCIGVYAKLLNVVVVNPYMLGLKPENLQGYFFKITIRFKAEYAGAGNNLILPLPAFTGYE